MCSLSASSSIPCIFYSRHDAHLLVKGATGGIWRFPVRFIATEPEPDDDIVIEATGLGKESSLGFRLTSMERYKMCFSLFCCKSSSCHLGSF